MNSLQGPSVMAVVGELVAAGVSQHVRAHLGCHEVFTGKRSHRRDKIFCPSGA